MAGKRPWARWLVIGAFMAGALDITYAIVFYFIRNHAPPIRILQSVATGWLGKAAFQGGAATAALGLATHFLNALIITAIFFLAAARIPALTRRPLVSGGLYGVVVYAVMNYVVIPLSAIGHFMPFVPIVFATGIIVHVFLIGVPIAWAASRAMK
jgi:hypothetical protein